MTARLRRVPMQRPDDPTWEVLPVKHHRAVPVAVRIFVLALALSSLLGAGALAQDGDQVVAGPTTPVPSASPAASQAPSASAQASPSVEGSPAASGLASVPDVTMRGSVFQPVTIEVTAGETVDWFNDDVTVHTVTAL